MQISFEYDNSYVGPAFPVLECRLLFEKRQTAEITAFIDTGSDATTVPRPLLTQIQAPIIDARWVRTLNNHRYRTDVFLLSIQIGDTVVYGVEALANDSSSELIVGRDVLNQFIITLNGLAHITSISDQ